MNINIKRQYIYIHTYIFIYTDIFKFLEINLYLQLFFSQSNTTKNLQWWLSVFLNLTLKEIVLKVKDFKGWFSFKNKIMTMIPEIRMKCITL